ncbi:MAG: D-alanyl-D-alanine dipeptidase [Firmicutes bacterium ADurb.Bin182]|nr:MAG: D-alanyl-D-alanine dipeptidase [Firmicutes bacterium ADurb.Bin182]
MQNITTRGIPKAGLPDGFVYIDELIPDCIIDAKYAGTDNLFGRTIAGYNQPLVVMTKEVAEGCIKAAEIFRKKGYLMKFFDSYRPQRAVDDFVKWGKDLQDERRKPIHYPNEEKQSMFEKGYIDKLSGHTRGCAVDLTLVNMKTWQEIDAGSIFDFMDARSNHGAAGLTKEQEDNRKLLMNVMCSCGFIPYQYEWWHYIIQPEPYPETYFDFPVE